MDYEAAVAWLYGRQALGIKLGLDKVHRLLAAVGDPHREMQILHVAGTNGKGTVCTLFDAALRNAGHRVGRFTSPHLIRFTERITVDGEEIAHERVAAHVTALQPIVAELDAADEAPTFFELVTVIALMEFRDQGVQWAVLEAGMGGRLDATNVVEPDLTIITNVGMDHQAFLGDHIVDIAAEKAGIMKPGVPCVTGATGDALTAIKATSRVVECPMSILDEDYHLLPDINGMRIASPFGDAHYDVAMAGEHQLRNAALVVLGTDALRQAGTSIPPEAVHRALATTRFPGRLEVIHCDGMEVLLDGAHNVDGAAALRRHFAQQDMAGFHLITGFSADKEWGPMLDQWAPLAATVHGVAPRSGRALDPAAMAHRVEGIGIPFRSHTDVASALNAAAEAGAEQVVVAGSLFLVGEARAHMLGESVEDIRGDQ